MALNGVCVCMYIYIYIFLQKLLKFDTIQETSERHKTKNIKTLLLPT